MSLVRQHEQVEVLVRLDQSVDHQQRVVWRHVIIHRAVRQQQMPFQVLRDILICLIVVIRLAITILSQQALIPLAPIVFVFTIVVVT